MRAINRHTGAEIKGSLETIPGTALLSPDEWSRNADGTLACEYEGETDVWWDGQETVQRDGQDVYVDTYGDECLATDVVLMPDEYFELAELAEHFGGETLRAMQDKCPAELIGSLAQEAGHRARMAQSVWEHAMHDAGHRYYANGGDE